MSALRGSEAATPRTAACSEHNLRTQDEADRLKEIRARWGEFPELVTQLVANDSLVRLSAMPFDKESPSRISRRKYRGASLQDHRHIDGHAETVVRPAGKTAGDGNGLADVPGDADADQVGAVDRPVCRIVSDPAGPRKVDVGPCMGRPNARGGRIAAVGGGIVEISGHHARSEAEATSRFDQRHGEIAARAPAAVERFNWGLRPLGFPALIRDR